MQVSRRALLGGSAALLTELALGRLARAAAPLPFPELEAAGSPGSLGLAHGRAASAAIGRNLAFYLRWLGAETKREPKALLALAGSFTAPLRRCFPAQLEELEGIARGAGRRLDEILLLNARTDLALLGRAPRPAPPPARPRAGAPVAADPPGCTSLALSGSAAGRPLLALGQTWDWQPDLKGGTLVLRLKPERGPRLVTFTEAGMLAKIGMNQHRLGVCLNFLGHKSDDPAAEPGVPIHCLLRAVLGCASLEEATKLVAWAPRCASANFLLAQAGAAPAALDLELTPTALARLLPRDGDLVHANHYKDPALAPGCDSGRGPSTLNRDRVAGELARKLRASEPDPARRMQRILVSREGAPLSISKTATAASPSVSLAGIVMDLSRNRLHLAGGPPHLSRWTERPGV